MKYISEFRDKALINRWLEKIHNITAQDITLMEVCGGHTMAIHRFGIPSLLPKQIRLLSGPGCPVCVTSREFIDRAVVFSEQKDTIITTYGDLIRVPGSDNSLEKVKANGADIRIVFSILEAIDIARKEPDKQVIFLGIGFETTTPASASGIIKASDEKIDNFTVLSAHKVMPPAMAALIDDGVKLDGYICPGHVSTITGSSIYQEIALKYKKGCVITGFEPVDILQSVYMLIKQIQQQTPRVEIQYSRAVKPEGNVKALQMMHKVFEPSDDWWRGLGVLPYSGLKIRKEYREFDAFYRFPVEVETKPEPRGCLCGEILKGLKKPSECKLFGKVCTPSSPVGACMVSSEGACAALFKYGN